MMQTMMIMTTRITTWILKPISKAIQSPVKTISKMISSTNFTYADSSPNNSGLKKSLTSIKSNQGKTLQYKVMLRAFEAKDRSVMEHNYERVNFWSTG